MKPPVTLDSLLAEWEKDSKIDKTEPGAELIKISSLHSKYTNILSYHRILTKKLSIDYNRKKLIMEEYFEGNLNNKEDLEKHGFKEPYLVKPGNRSKIPKMIEVDDEITKIGMKKVVHEEIVEVVTSILKELHSRTFQLRSYIDWRKFIGEYES